MWYSVIGFFMTFLLGLLVSALSRAISKRPIANLDENLFFPVIARRIRSRQRDDIEIVGVVRDAHEKKYSFNNAVCENESAANRIGTKL